MADIANLQIKVDTNQVKTANKDLDSLSRSSKNAESSSKQLTTSFLSMRSALAGLGVAASAVQLAKIADSYTKLTSQLKLATQNQLEFNQAYANVQRIAETAQSSIAETGVLYARLSTSLRELNATQQQVADITEAVALGLKISGANASETASVLTQLGQAFDSGVLRSEEFNAVNENGGRIMRAIAEHLGVARGELKGMATDGKLTSDVIGNALIKALEKMRVEAEKTRNISGGITQVKNEFVLLVGEIDKATGASTLLAKAFATMAEQIKAMREGRGSILGSILESVPVGGPVIGVIDMFRPKSNAGRIATGTITRAGETGETPLLKARAAKIDQDELERQRRKNEQKRQEHLRMRNELLEMDRKYLEISNNVENKIIEESRKAREDSIAKIMEIEQRRANENFEEAQRMSKKTTDEWKDAFESLKDAVNGYSREMTQSFVDFALTGKASFGDMINSMLRDLLRLYAQKKIFDPLTGAISGAIDAGSSSGGGFFGFLSGFAGSLFGSSNSYGSEFSSSGDYIGGYYEDGVQIDGRRASGGSVSAGKNYIVGEKGIEIFSPSSNGSIIPNNKLGGSNVSVVINNNSQSQATATETTDARGNRRIEVTIGDMVASEIKRTGSDAYQAIRGTFATRPRLVGR